MQSTLSKIILSAFLVAIPTLNAQNCDGQDAISGTGSMGDFDVTIILNCTEETMQIDLTYSSYSNGWFGWVFNNYMNGNALVYTTGKDGNSPEALHSFEITAKNPGGVNANPSADWTELSTTENNGIEISYINDLSNTQFTVDTTTVNMRFAWRTTLALTKHTQTSSTLSVNLAAPTPEPTTPPPTTPEPTIAGCPNGNELTESVNTGDLAITMTLDCANEKILVDITYSDYNDNWFGLVFNNQMNGAALIYTTGKTSGDAAAGYSYDIISKSSAGVTRDAANDWTEISTTTSNGIQVIYEQDFSNTDWDRDTTEITFRYAIGASLQLEKHDSTSQAYTLTFDGIHDTPSPTTPSGTTATPTTATEDEGCGGTASGTLGDFIIETTIDCDNEIIQLNLTYTEYNNNWVGVVFNDVMNGDALIWTTGKSGTDTPGLYSFTISSKSLSGVQPDSSSDWREISVSLDNGFAQVVYEQDLSATQFSTETKTIPVRVAYGSSSLQLEYHDTRTTNALTLDLESGGSNIVEDDLSMQYAHGVIMWCAWSLFASIGIMASAFRWTLENKPKGFWFKIHRSIQGFTVILCIIGFILAIVFTEDAGMIHFNNPHMICGLVVTILCVLQPINAFIRPHPAGPNESKPLGRFIWEIVHKSFGYIAWILGCITAYLGLRLPMIDAIPLSQVHLFGWCLLLLLIYIALFIMGWSRKSKNAHIKATNDGHQSHQSSEDLVGGAEPIN